MTELRAILSVEDSDEDFEALRMALATAGAVNPLLRCDKAHQALDPLDRRAAERDGEDLPALVLLDLNLPDMHGRDVLDRIRADARLRATPVIVLSTSTNPRDVTGCHGAGANAYLVKPVGLEEFEAMIQALVDFWLRAATLPAPFAHWAG